MTETTFDYRAMWADMGLDLAKHDALLGVLGQLYTDVYLSQTDRPQGMGYFDFVMSEVHGLRIKELMDAKAAGRVVVGSFCTFVPEELILAVGGVSVGLCAGAEFGTDRAEEILPRTTCALIKSAFGFALERVCPYIAASDLVVGENTCDGKKKAFEHFGELVDRFYAMDLPQTKSAAGRELLRTEYHRFAAELEALSGRRIEAPALARAIAVVNAKRAAMHRLDDLRRAIPAPISGLDALLANQVFFYDDPVRFTESVNKLCDELEGRARHSEGVFPADAPRVLVSGCPMAVPNWKPYSLIEGAGAVVVGEESCVGRRGTQDLTSTEGRTVDEMMDAIVDRYAKIDCAIFSPNPTRREHVRRMAVDQRADGVIHYALQFCQPYQIEAPLVERAVTGAGLPVLRIETDYSAGDVEQLRTRIEAFVEQLRHRRAS